MTTRIYREWLVKSDFNFKRFNLLADLLEKFLLQYRLDNDEFTRSVASKFEDVLSNCDEIDYQDDETATAYGILHFLNRYHRFQLNFLKLLEHRFLPTRNYKMDILDVGTGPGPALFAISDAYISLKLFAEELNIKRLKNLEFRCDYVERSIGFRNWLHHLTEYVNYYSEKEPDWQVPYHHGTFNDFSGIQFNELSGFWDTNWDGDYIYKNHIIKHRFNVVIFSNFLTKIDQVEEIKQELINSVRYLRNQGILIIVGGVGKQYPKIYDRIENILTKEDYNTWKFYARCKKLKIRQNTLTFSYDDRFGQRIKHFNRKILKRFQECDAIKCIPEKARKVFLDSIENEYAYKNRWNMHVYEKFARIRNKKYANRKLTRKSQT
ncbi:MAG: hypothetical protein R2828_35915 [Saprospiraceae bacterium]